MFGRKKKHDIPELNTTSTSDISFMLLIFFLVTSSMDTDKGLTRQLPIPEDKTEEQDLVVKRRNVMELHLDASDRLTCDGDTIDAAELTKRVKEFVANESGDAGKPELSEREVHLLGRCKVSDRHVIFIETAPETTYDAYFQMQNAIVAAYSGLRDNLARKTFRRPYSQCTQEQRDAIAMVYPQRISERIEEEEPRE